MVSNKYYLGDLIKQRREKNPGGDLPIRGVSKDGLQPPKQIDADTSIYNVYYRNDFIFNPARMELGSIAFNNEYDKAICSSLYEVFYVYRTDLVMPEYLALFVKHPEFARYCNYIGNGSAREYCRFDNISEIPIVLPSLPEQRKIVHDYKVITDRIELLRKMNEKLDAIAYTCYKELLLSEDKSRWHTGTLRELLTVKYGKDHSALADGPFPLYGSGGLMRFVERPLYDKVSVLIPRKGSLNNIMYVDEPFWSVDTMFYTEIANPKAAKFVCFFLRDIDFLGLNTGSAVPSTSSDVIHDMQLEVPPDKDLEKFDDIVTPLFAQIKANNNERDKLEALRVLVSSIVTKGV